MAKRKGKLFIISAPSGSGKTTLCDIIKKRMKGLMQSVSMTTREPRLGEKHNSHYIFVSKKQFKENIKKQAFVEWVRNLGNYYGTPKKGVLSSLAKGTDVIVAIDVKGAMKVKKLYRDSVSIFILPPSFEELKKRLKNRNADDKQEMAKRLRLAKKELSCVGNYDYSLVNDNIKKAASELEAIIRAERRKVKK